MIVGGQRQYNFRSKLRQERDEWFKIRMYVLHNEWVPRQVRLDCDRFENAWFEGIEKFVIAFCEFVLRFLLKGFVVEDAYSNEYVEE